MLDIACRNRVFERDNHTCQTCSSKENLQWSHVQSRRYYATRWEDDNSLCQCATCHLRAEHNKRAFHYWFAQKFPLRWERIDSLLRHSAKVTRKDIRDMALAL